MALILSVNNKQLLDKVFVTSGITEVEVSVAKCYQPSRFFFHNLNKNGHLRPLFKFFYIDALLY